MTDHAHPTTDTAPRTRSVQGACPLDCPDGCAWVVDLVDDQPVRLRPNKSHPFTGNALCVKTTPYLGVTAADDRLLYPQRRVGPKGSGQFERVSWDDALDEMATRLHETIRRSGGEAIWPYAGSGTVGWVQGIGGAGKRLFHKLGASRHDPNICSTAGHVGLSYTSDWSAGMDPEDLSQSQLILLWATDPIVTNRHLWPFIKQAQKNGAVLVTLDPVVSDTARHSDLHLALRPGSDGALALAVMHQLFERGAADESYLKSHTRGWEAFRDDILPRYPLETAAAITGLDVAEIEQLVDLIATRRPMGVRTSMGLQRHQGGGQAARVLSCLPVVTGDDALAGGGLCYSTGRCYPWNVDGITRPDLQPGPTRSLAMSRLGEGLLELNDPPVEALVLWAANPMASNPDQNRVRAGLSREDLFTVVIDHVQTDTADYADLLLPGTMQTEHADLHDSFSHLYVQWNEPAVPPRGESLPHTELFRRLARHMGLDEPCLYDSDEELARAALDAPNTALDGITLERLKDEGWARLNLPKPYLPFKNGYPTASGKFEFDSERGEADGVGRFPDYTPPREAGREEKDGSLVLFSPANKFLINSVFASSPLHARAGGPVAVLHPDEAERRGLVDGQTVRIRNGRGTFDATLEVSTRTPPGIVLSAKGQWPKRTGGHAVNATVPEHDADMGRGAVFFDNRVWVEAAAPSG